MAIFCSFLAVFSKPSTNYELENVARGTLAQCTGKQRCTKLCTVAVSDSHWRPTHESSCKVSSNSVAYQCQQSGRMWTEAVGPQPSRRAEDSESLGSCCPAPIYLPGSYQNKYHFLRF